MSFIHLKKPGLFGEMAESSSKAEKCKMSLAPQKARELSKSTVVMLKRLRANSKEASAG
jgi:hypothetical protein